MTADPSISSMKMMQGAFSSLLEHVASREAPTPTNM